MFREWRKAAMNRFVKTILLTGALTLSVGLSAFAANTEKDLANEISVEPGTFYTLYVGMPPEDYHNNWDNLPGWTSREGQEPRTPTVFSIHDREIKVDGKKALESVCVTYTAEKNLYYISYRLYSNDVGMLVGLYKYVYDNCAKNYPGFDKQVKFDPVPHKGLGGSMKLDNGTTVRINSFQLTPHQGKPMKYKYSFELTYEESYRH